MTQTIPESDAKESVLRLFQILWDILHQTRVADPLSETELRPVAIALLGESDDSGLRAGLVHELTRCQQLVNPIRGRIIDARHGRRFKTRTKQTGKRKSQSATALLIETAEHVLTLLQRIATDPNAVPDPVASQPVASDSGENNAQNVEADLSLDFDLDVITRPEWNLRQVSNTCECLAPILQVLTDDIRREVESEFVPLLIQPPGPPLIESAIAETKQSDGDKRPKMTVADANKRAMELAKKMKRKFFALTIREQAKLIGCHFSTWKRTSFFSEAEKKRPAKQSSAVPSRRAGSLTGGMEETLHDGKKDEVLNRLIDEHQRDDEPSPIDESPRRAYSNKRL